ncbi:MAG: CvpA family protein [Deferribacteraceae bacterium]|jgi:uncharacterized membrane protein required for colicin V production|nr:CvpA family protein [Deferribacteraceae bacterium]
MTLFDIATLVIVVLFGLLGFRKGLLYELLLLVLAAAVFLVSYFITPYILEFLNKFIVVDERTVFPILYSVLICISISFLGGIISLLGKAEKPSLVSRGCGALLGLFFGVLFTGVLLWAAVVFIPSLENTLTEGIITGNAMNIVALTYGFLEKVIRDNDITPFTIMNYTI